MNTCKNCKYSYEKNFETNSNKMENIGLFCIKAKQRVSSKNINYDCHSNNKGVRK